MIDIVSVLADLGGLITSPRQTFRIIFAEKRGLLPAVVVFLVMVTVQSLVTVSNFIARFLGLTESFLGGFGGSLSAFIGLLGVAGMIIVGTIFWLILGLLTHAFARFLGGKADIEKALIVLGYAKVSFFIYVILAFAAIFTSFLVSLGLLIVGYLISVVLWVIVASTGVSEAYGISMGRGLASVILPFIVLATIPFLMFIPFMFW